MNDIAKVIGEHTAKGWKVVSDGPSGVQLEAPKAMKGLDKAALIAGVFLLLFFWPLGLLLIVMALIDYAFLTKPETKFVGRG